MWFDTKRHLAPLTFDQYWSIVVCYQFYCVESVNALAQLSNPFWQATNTSSSQVNYNDYIGTPANGLSRFFPLFVYKMNYHTKINDYFKSFFSISTFQEWESRKSSSEKKKLIAHNSTRGIFLYNFAHFNTIKGETVATKSTFRKPKKIWVVT